MQCDQVANLRGIVTAPTLLESTSLVFAYGVDLFFSRVTPSKDFDLLSEGEILLLHLGDVDVCCACLICVAHASSAASTAVIVIDIDAVASASDALYVTLTCAA